MALPCHRAALPFASIRMAAHLVTLAPVKAASAAAGVQNPADREGEAVSLKSRSLASTLSGIARAAAVAGNGRRAGRRWSMPGVNGCCVKRVVKALMRTSPPATAGLAPIKGCAFRKASSAGGVENAARGREDARRPPGRHLMDKRCSLSPAVIQVFRAVRTAQADAAGADGTGRDRLGEASWMTRALGALPRC